MKAENCGANCSECPLRDSEEIVYPERNTGTDVAIVADYPNDFEVQYQRPLVGPTAKPFADAMREASVFRGQFFITYSVLCRPPDNNMKKYLATIKTSNRKLKTLNRQRAKLDQSPLPMIKTPQECCEPRLKKELSKFFKIITMGTYATKAVLHHSASVMSLRGSPTIVDRDENKVRILPTFHPSMVNSSPKWTVPFRNDFIKAIKWFQQGLDWKPPHVIYHPSAKELREFLWQPNVPYWAYDVETDGVESLTAGLRCIGIGTSKAVVIVGLKGIDGRTKFYKTQKEENDVIRVLQEFFTDSSKLKMGWNSGYFDRMVIENHLGITPSPHVDAMLFHRLAESELPHSLGFAGSMYSEAPSWKTDREGRKKAYGSETDFELHEYCAYDVAITAEVLPPLQKRVVEREQIDCLQCDHKLQMVCADMHKVGMHVDQPTRLKFEHKFMHEIQERRETIRVLSEKDHINPASTLHLRTLLYEDWNLLPYLIDRMEPKEYLTDGGEPSTSDDIMRALLTIPVLEPNQRQVIENIRLYRRAQKMLGTYVTKLRYNNQEAWGGWDEEDDWIEKDLRDQYGLKKLGIVDPETNRMHPGYNVHVTVTGRLSSSKPINAQNFPKALRAMITPAPGNVLVGADMDQLELRIAASRWKSSKYLKAFADGLDPHSSVTAHSVFGKKFEQEAIKCGAGAFPWKTGTKFSDSAAKLRNLSKAVALGIGYLLGKK